jgi:hypothetical protein
MTLSATLTPSAFGLGGNGGIPKSDNVVLTYPMAASSSVSSGDWVKLSSTTAGTITKCTSTADNPIGIAFTNIDNTYKDDGVTAGAAGDKYCAVLRKGFAYMDAIITASGVYGSTPIGIDAPLYLSGSATATLQSGQLLTPTTDTALGTVIVARALDYVPVPTTTAMYKIRVYIDRLNKSVLVA